MLLAEFQPLQWVRLIERWDTSETQAQFSGPLHAEAAVTCMTLRIPTGICLEVPETVSRKLQQRTKLLPIDMLDDT